MTVTWMEYRPWQASTSEGMSNGRQRQCTVALTGEGAGAGQEGTRSPAQLNFSLKGGPAG